MSVAPQTPAALGHSTTVVRLAAEARSRVLQRAKDDPTIASLRLTRQRLAELKAQERQIWEAPGQCLVSGCSDLAVRSHSIQRGGPLAVIAENDHVRTPYFSGKRWSFERVPIRRASLFQGYCRAHDDQLFAGFEKHGAGIETAQHLSLQIARSFQRELTRVRRIDRHYADTLRSLLQAMDERFTDMLREEIGPQALQEHPELADFTLNGLAEVRGLVARNLAHYEQRQAQLEAFAPVVAAYLDTGHALIAGMHTERFTLPISLPFACSAIGAYSIKLPSAPLILLMLMVVLPAQSKTHVAFCCPANEHSFLRTFLRGKGVFRPVTTKPWETVDRVNFRRLLEYAEQFTFSSTDHYFIRPSAWDSLPDRQRDRVYGLLNNRGNLLPPWRTPIFDSAYAELTALGY